MKNQKYFAKEIGKINNGTSPEGHQYWNYLKIGVFERMDDGSEVQIGEYERNYSSFYNTFYAFKIDEKWYALYSRDYTSTRVMTLPDCKDLCGEERHSFGFCPTGFYVPWDDHDVKDTWESFKDLESRKDYDDIPEPWKPGTFGFVCGCVWGDDNGWKIQFLDLREIENGILKRDDRFGYIKLCGSSEKLEKAFDFGLLECGKINIACSSAFDMNKFVDGEEE